MRRTPPIAWALAVCCAGCGGTTRDVEGRLDLSALGHARAELIATDTDGQSLSAPVGTDERFEVELEVGRTYAVAFRDPSTPKDPTFASLVFRASIPVRATVQIVPGDEIDLGGVDLFEGGLLRRSSCRGIDDDSSRTELRSSFLVVSETDLAAHNQPDDNPHTDDGLRDTDGDLRPDAHDDDHDADGVCDEDGHARDGGEADLPYDVRLAEGTTFVLADAFAQKGPQPAQLLDVEMSSGSWRLEELRGLTPFVVTPEDCEHEGNAGAGRDRIFVTWKNTSGSLDIDHLDLRYCDS